MTAEQSLKIPLRDGKFVFGRLRGDWSQPLVIFLHGFSTNMNRIIPYEASKFLAENGYSFLRYNAFDSAEDARRLTDITLEVQSRDLTDIVDFARGYGAKKIHVMGHSYGGLTILLSPQLQVESAILADPSHPDVDFTERTTPLSGRSELVFPSKGVDMLISSNTVTEYRALNPADYVAKFKLPAAIISADAGPLAATNREYSSALSAKLVEIAGADHTFDTDEHLAGLLSAALDWLQSRASK